MATVVVDFDGVIHAYRDGWQDGRIYDDPVPGAKAGLELLMTHYTVAVVTARENLYEVADWITERLGIHCHVSNQVQFWDRQETILVSNRKIPAAVYVDDRGLRFTTWDGIEVQVREVL